MTPIYPIIVENAPPRTERVMRIVEDIAFLVIGWIACANLDHITGWIR